MNLFYSRGVTPLGNCLFTRALPTQKLFVFPQKSCTQVKKFPVCKCADYIDWELFLLANRWPEDTIGLFLPPCFNVLFVIYLFYIIFIQNLFLEETMKCLPVQILSQIYKLIFGHVWEWLVICDWSNIEMLIKARWNTLGKLHSNTLKTFCSDVRGQLTNTTAVQMHSNTLKHSCKKQKI